MRTFIDDGKRVGWLCQSRTLFLCFCQALNGIKWDKMALALIIILNKSIQKVNA